MLESQSFVNLLFIVDIVCKVRPFAGFDKTLSCKAGGLRKIQPNRPVALTLPISIKHFQSLWENSKSARKPITGKNKKETKKEGVKNTTDIYFPNLL